MTYNEMLKEILPVIERITTDMMDVLRITSRYCLQGDIAPEYLDKCMEFLKILQDADMLIGLVK